MAKKRAKKKHRGIKDPYKQIEARFAKIKDKINCKPANEQSQEISRRLQLISDYDSKAKTTKTAEELAEINERKKFKKPRGRTAEGHRLMDTATLMSQEKEEPGMDRPLKMVPRIIQYSNETDEDFYRRVVKASKDTLSEYKFEEKYKVDVERDAKGVITKVKNRKMTDDILLPEKKRVKLQQREKLKKDKKKERDFKRKHKNQKNDDEDDFDEFKDYQDEVQFGEVVYEPPSLDTTRFTKKTNGIEKKSKFLFMEKLTGSQTDKTAAELTALRKGVLEEERLKAVQAYREMKAAKYKEQNMALSIC